MTPAFGLALALGSAFALNWGFLAQHANASTLPPLRLRHPLTALRALFTNRGWLRGFLAGLSGWGLYVVALALAPLSLVQATSASGIGILALLIHHGRSAEQLHPREWAASCASVAGLALLGLSLSAGQPHSATATTLKVAGWVGGLALAAALAATLLGGAVGLGAAAGILYAAADIATKAATDAEIAFIPVVLAASALAFTCLQLGFQRGRAMTTIGLATLLTNTLPIAAGIILFKETPPAGALGLARSGGFVLATLAATLLARPADHPRATTQDRAASAGIVRSS